MSEIVIKFLLAGETFMPEMHFKQTWFTYSAWRPFTKNKKNDSKILRKRRYKTYLEKWAR